MQKFTTAIQSVYMSDICLSVCLSVYLSASCSSHGLYFLCHQQTVREFIGSPRQRSAVNSKLTLTH